MQDLEIFSSCFFSSQMTNNHLIGRRVIVQNIRGTIKWVGDLNGLTSQRAGIELDHPPENGQHSGEYEGNGIFPCRENCGVFVKVCKLNFGVTLKQAIEHKYLNQENTSTGSSILVGGEKARKYFAENLFDLEEISLDSCGVRFDRSID